ncbi:carbamate kinase [Vagococcus intermedius]|uniref:Carbamate kinase n=1 Tax=Vagococcus intermedius TaxID=2991418 RepID=A0AAF0CVY5_9ENTE|nr:carbamate kinase [Vagococcus intermedius]WEG73974.1 carbamate kinase [Vagococcus intermedius]WEG76054.1 carbamate kinase [Vagococcus intermedius]
MTQTVVIALGGNAILTDDPTAEAQQLALKKTVKHLIPLVKKGYRLVISHGNGPQVGNLILQQNEADSPSNPALPLDSCVAMTQGSIGYWLEQALRNELQNQGLENQVATIMTQVVVDQKDPAFHHPSKPIGPFYTESEACILKDKKVGSYIEDAGRGWRKVVPSPRPIEIIGHQIITYLLEKQVITISAGGGGIPVVREPLLRGIEAVIDKDFASEKLAELVGADALIILTGVDYVALDYGTDKQRDLTKVSISELETYKEAGQFAPGSMLPKVEAVITFVKSGANKKAMITSLEKLAQFELAGVGTTVISDG